MVEINKIYVGDCIDVMKSWPENFVDTIITDPPYGIRFMGKAWDGADIDKTIQSKSRKNGDRCGEHGKMATENRAWAAGEYDTSVTGNYAFQQWCCLWATEALRIAKPGALMLVSGGTRTFHRMTAGLEDAGWQIRDCLMWLYGSGFPKSHNLHGKFEGWGTALKPAWEPIIVAMKPIDGTFAENAEKWGVAGLNVDGGRIGCREEVQITGPKRTSNAYGKIDIAGGKVLPDGRWPANLLLDEDAAAMLDGQSGDCRTGAVSPYLGKHTGHYNGGWGPQRDFTKAKDRGGASRFFYVAKSGKAERNEGCEGLATKFAATMGNGIGEREHDPANPRAYSANHHPTVKPLSLMKYLCNLTRTPSGGIVLDPFAGSGTTLWAAEFHNRPWLGIEMNAEYVAIANARIANERSQIKMAI